MTPAIARIITIVTAAFATAASGQQPASTTLAAPRGGITDVPGIKVGHHTLTERPTGCTVVLVDGAGAVGAVSQRGGAPGTRETDLLDPGNLVDKVNAVVLTGGSAFGLESASGVVRWLEEHGIGWRTQGGPVPIVPAAVLYDLTIGGNPRVRPDAACGYAAANAASSGAVEEGSVGAGAGATVGKLGGAIGGARSGYRSMKGGVGTASIALPSGLVVGALVAVNAAGDIVDPESGAIVAGALAPDGTLADARKLLRAGALAPRTRPGENTTIAVVATNARLTKAEAARVASMADDGLARTVVPSHTIFDGDTVFALATGTWAGEPEVSTVGALAAQVLADAVVRAVRQASGVAGITSARELKR
jgi:L-aminopeptidase/D-esterase-like protein